MKFVFTAEEVLNQDSCSACESILISVDGGKHWVCAMCAFQAIDYLAALEAEHEAAMEYTIEDFYGIQWLKAVAAVEEAKGRR